MDILVDVSVPEEYVSALRGDGHQVVYSRSVPALGSEATDEAIVSYAETEGLAVLSTDIKDFSERTADAAILVAPWT
jgi:predicted nuclease of predicted toxin-antitoxin system